ncbi:calreticulin-like isoform X2 [Hippocampus zosterae]|uniref:calreticulin-like isoform X1 n=1 Tax=Hippocampus zosterae TaxID=109293 RepID=UPI00223DE3D2|nr:calreticulin-like isoform X1 [Hippocampus zosterae]XP_051929564.1 calreticulin-like isoform X2 [Hippocampus zosterae]
MPLPAAFFVLVASLACSGHATVFFKEQFLDGDGWRSRWVESKHKDDYGKWTLSAGKLYGDAELDKGVQTSEDAHFYALSARMEPFSNEGKVLVIQFSVRHQQGIDCGGGYIKIFDARLDQTQMNANSPFSIMFGPDICGAPIKKVHVILNYKGQGHQIKKNIPCKDDELSHVYTLVLRPDQTYQVKIDNREVASGSLEDDWDLLPPKTIKDPLASKPADWDDRPTMPDPDDTKPEDWDQPETIPDPKHRKPSDWREDIDGVWSRRVMLNPDYKGDWTPRQIDNPKYEGLWVPPEIPNPDYVHDAEMYKFHNIGVLGLELWQMRSGTVFDNFLITDDIREAEEFARQTWGLMRAAEKKMKEEQDELERKKWDDEHNTKDNLDVDFGDDHDDKADDKKPVRKINTEL